jgi:hypothetical protein
MQDPVAVLRVEYGVRGIAFRLCKALCLEAHVFIGAGYPWVNKVA